MEHTSTNGLLQLLSASNHYKSSSLHLRPPTPSIGEEALQISVGRRIHPNSNNNDINTSTQIRRRMTSTNTNPLLQLLLLVLLTTLLRLDGCHGFVEPSTATTKSNNYSNNIRRDTLTHMHATTVMEQEKALIAATTKLMEAQQKSMKKNLQEHPSSNVFIATTKDYELVDVIDVTESESKTKTNGHHQTAPDNGNDLYTHHRQQTNGHYQSNSSGSNKEEESNAAPAAADAAKAMTPTTTAMFKLEETVESDDVIDNDEDVDDDDLTYDQEEQESPVVSIRSLWRRRHARCIVEGIRRETTSEQLSSLLQKVTTNAGGDGTLSTSSTLNHPANANLIARTLTGFISAVAEEADGLKVEVNARRDSPLWEKHIDSLQINFSRLGFQPLRLGGLHNAVQRLGQKKTATTSTQLSTRNSQNSKNNETELEVFSINEAFEKIDVDKSGTLDRDEIATALDIVTASTNSDGKLLTSLATELVELYDTNGDGVVDFQEYQLMVEDMAALRQIELDRKKQLQQDEEKQIRWFFGLGRGTNKSDDEGSSDKTLDGDDDDDDDDTVSSSYEKSPIKGTGTITLTGLKLDLRRLLFGAVPFVKKITPGGPLVLEPFTASIHGSFTQEDIMESLLVDIGLRRLVARALRRRVRSVRDIMDGAVFYGRSWNMASVAAPLVEVPELTGVEFDAQDRLIITGRALVRTSPDAPVIENAFKVRTKLGTRMNGQMIRLEQPELALVVECPKSWERNIVSICKKFNWPTPRKPDPLYSFFPIYSPFKIEDNDGFDLGPDNCIKSIYVKDGALRFEMQAILRPGRFLGNHYVAFTLPMRTFLITLDRVLSGVRSARKNKRAKINDDNNKKINHAASFVESSNGNHNHDDDDDSLTFVDNTNTKDATARSSKASRKLLKPKKKSFFQRFVEGYLGVAKDEEVRNERLTAAISEWFGRQGRNTN